MEKIYWFPAKTHGLGWGLPTAWQGWVVLVVFAISVVLTSYYFPPRRRRMHFGLLVLTESLILLGVCVFKGEPTGWI